MEYQIIDKIPSVTEYQSLRTAIGWHNHPIAIAEKSLQNSIYSVCAIDGDKSIGFGRIVGDGYLYFYFQDVMVLPDYRCQGIGYQIVKQLYDRVISIAQPGAFFGLMAAPGASTL
jgi:GNAT superfamily N-acetyltransferase